MKKDVIYIDVEDDITAILANVMASKEQLVAIVPPKRSTVLQSSVNMKLLKKAADDGKKKLVVVSNEKSLLPLVGATGLYAAKNLQSKPEIPHPPEDIELDEDVIEDEPKIDAKTAVGDLAKEPKKAEPKKQKKADKGPKVPNFKRFRLKIILLSVFVIGGFGFWFLGFIVLPSADIALDARTSNIDTTFNFKVDTSIEEDNIENSKLAGTTETIKRSLSESFVATGKDNIGQKATGTVTITNNCFNPGTIAKGTRFTSNSDLVFVSTQAVKIADAVPSAGNCNSPTTADVSVRATQSGDNYNLAPVGYSVGNFGPDVTGFGTQMSGGTTEIATVVSDKDVKTATDELLNQDNSEYIAEVKDLFGANVFVLEDSLKIKNSDPIATPKVGDRATEGTVAAEFTFQIIGVDKTSLVTIVKNQLDTQINTSEQTVLNSGIDTARTTITERTGSEMKVKYKGVGIVGPEFDLDALAEEVAGKRYSETQEILESKAGIESATVEYSPFWVFSTPKASKVDISVNVEESSPQQ